MATNAMYELAFQFGATKLWAELSDGELFAVRHTDGAIGYCCVMGNQGEHIALADYVGEAAFQSYLRLAHATDTQSVTPELIWAQDCLQCSFEDAEDVSDGERQEAAKYAEKHGIRLRRRKAIPQFLRYRPFCQPWRVEDKLDRVRICEALAAAKVLSELLKTHDKETLRIVHLDDGPERIPLFGVKNGKMTMGSVELPAMTPPEYPAPALRNDVTAERLRRGRRVGAMECDVFLYPEPQEDEKGGAPRFPFLLLCVLQDEQEILNLPPVTDYETSAEDLVNYFAEAMAKDGRTPKEIQVRDARTAALLRELCEKAEIPLRRVEALSLLDDLEDRMLSELLDEDELPRPQEDQDAYERRMLQELGSAFDGMSGGLGAFPFGDVPTEE